MVVLVMAENVAVTALPQSSIGIAWMTGARSVCCCLSSKGRRRAAGKALVVMDSCVGNLKWWR